MALWRKAEATILVAVEDAQGEMWYLLLLVLESFLSSPLDRLNHLVALNKRCWRSCKLKGWLIFIAPSGYVGFEFDFTFDSRPASSLRNFEQAFEWLAQICKGVPAIVSVKVRKWKRQLVEKGAWRWHGRLGFLRELRGAIKCLVRSFYEFVRWGSSLRRARWVN